MMSPHWSRGQADQHPSGIAVTRSQFPPPLILLLFFRFRFCVGPRVGGRSVQRYRRMRPRSKSPPSPTRRGPVFDRLSSCPSFLNALSRSVPRISTTGSAWNPRTSLRRPDLKRIAGLPERARDSYDRSRILRSGSTLGGSSRRPPAQQKATMTRAEPTTTGYCNQPPVRCVPVASVPLAGNSNGSRRDALRCALRRRTPYMKRQGAV